MNDSNTPTQGHSAYQVLARKYRPQSFADLLGHEAMVRTLRNAFAMDRIAHAYMLTGVRGVGKTTTARILARALNYAAPGVDGPQIDMPETGVHCDAIAQSHHQDVMEMDAASRTGVSDIRELIEGVRYAPVQARYKVYIIDEIHMLSTNAFNALLKTLEEPPPHVKFIFATTEIRKVPVTVLSRCQRFDLRRFDQEILVQHLNNIAQKEDVAVEMEGLRLIAKASEGSVRDALSLLDQAIIQRLSGDTQAVTAAHIQTMLGLSDRSASWDMLEASLAGQTPDALRLFQEQYDLGVDPAVILRDLLERTHLLTRVKAAGDSLTETGAAGEATRARNMATKLQMNALTRAWALLLKGLEETQSAPDAMAAAEMALIRLSYASDLPTPDEALRLLKEQVSTASAAPRAPNAHTGEKQSTVPVQNVHPIPAVTPLRQHDAAISSAPTDCNSSLQPDRAVAVGDIPAPGNLEDVVALASQFRDTRLREEIEKFVRVVSFSVGRMEIRLTDGAPANLAGRISQKLGQWTGERWIVTVDTNAQGAKTLREQRNDMVFAHPLVKAVMRSFPQLDKVNDFTIRKVDRLPDTVLSEKK